MSPPSRLAYTAAVWALLLAMAPGGDATGVSAAGWDLLPSDAGEYTYGFDDGALVNVRWLEGFQGESRGVLRIEGEQGASLAPIRYLRRVGDSTSSQVVLESMEGTNPDGTEGLEVQFIPGSVFLPGRMRRGKSLRSRSAVVFIDDGRVVGEGAYSARTKYLGRESLYIPALNAVHECHKVRRKWKERAVVYGVKFRLKGSETWWFLDGVGPVSFHLGDEPSEKDRVLVEILINGG